MVSKLPFVHGLVTRIGIGVYDEEWFKYRLSLFEAITVPSIQAQTCQDFTWLFVIDESMPPTAEKRFTEIIAPIANAKVLRVEFKSSLPKAVATWAKAKAAEEEVECVLTSRLDDDDALHRDAFMRLHDKTRALIADGVSLAGLSYSIGVMWIPTERRGYTRYHDSHSPGLSVLESVSDCRGIHAWPHQEIKRKLAPRGAYIHGFDGTEPLWLYAVHVLADSDTGDQQRLKRVRTQRHGYDIDTSTLVDFGLDPDTIDALASLGEPKAAKPVMRLATRARNHEKEIIRLRKLLIAASDGEKEEILRRIAEVDAIRRGEGSGIVSTSRMPLQIRGRRVLSKLSKLVVR